MTTIRNIVLVHGGFVDGSGWQGVYDELARDGFQVRIVQNPTLSLEGDVAATRQVLDVLDGPVGHSYGGVVISEAGTHPNVAALAYIAAFAPDKGEPGASRRTRGFHRGDRRLHARCRPGGLGDPRRHPPRVRHPWLRRHLLATTAHRTLLRVRAGDRPRGWPARCVRTHTW
ncbi:alpha/beta fold hydrolase [Streptosporangium sp. NPDC006013]|uniref:alpha/beta fold hydrolase n=1 Tax=Streptosporangium sp. NPDC006013 TaxID=3155596 RepID=UPI0033AB91DF